MVLPYTTCAFYEIENPLSPSLYSDVPAVGVPLLSGTSTDTSFRWRSVVRWIWNHEVHRDNNQGNVFVPYSCDAFGTRIDLWACLVGDVPFALAKIQAGRLHTDLCEFCPLTFYPNVDRTRRRVDSCSTMVRNF